MAGALHDCSYSYSPSKSMPDSWQNAQRKDRSCTAKLQPCCCALRRLPWSGLLALENDECRLDCLVGWLGDALVVIRAPRLLSPLSQGRLKDTGLGIQGFSASPSGRISSSPIPPPYNSAWARFRSSSIFLC